MSKITIFTDGCTEPNPGQSGFAAVLIATDEAGNELKRRIVHGYEKDSTNQRAEISAAIIGLDALLTPSEVEVISDSQYVIKTMKGEYSAKTNLDLWERLFEVANRHTVTWTWVKGHNGTPGNELAHTESVKAMRLKGRL